MTRNDMTGRAYWIIPIKRNNARIISFYIILFVRSSFQTSFSNSSINHFEEVFLQHS